MIKIKIKRHYKKDKKKEVITFVIVLLLTMSIFIYAINYFIGQQKKLSKEARHKTKDLLYTMRMKETSYSLSQPIKIRLEVRNISNKPVVLKFNENLECDFLVQKEVNLMFARIPMTVWRYSASVGMKKLRHSFTLAPQQAKVYKATWNQKDFNNRQVKPGNYIISGIFNEAGQHTELMMRGKMKKKK